MATTQRVKINWVRFWGEGPVQVNVIVQTVDELGTIVSQHGHEQLEFSEDEQMALDAARKRIGELVLGAQLNTVKVIPGRAAMRAVIDETTGEVLRAELPAVPTTYRTEGPRFEGITDVAWTDAKPKKEDAGDVAAVAEPAKA